MRLIQKLSLYEPHRPSCMSLIHCMRGLFIYESYMSLIQNVCICNTNSLSDTFRYIAVAPDEPAKVMLEDLPGMYDTLMHRHWMQGSLRALENNVNSRWIADEMYKLNPMTSPRWVP